MSSIFAKPLCDSASLRETAFGIASSVGLYYLLRSTAITPAAFVDALLWRSDPALPFFVASAAGFLGIGWFALGEK